MKHRLHILGALVAFSLTACSGGGTLSSLPATGAHTSSVATGSVTAKATVSSGLHLASTKFRRIASLRGTSSVSISAVEVDGTLYPGYAGTSAVTNTQKLTPVNGQVSIDMTFSNVPAGNNEWMVLQLYAVAPDGSKFDIGQLASLVNVSNGQSNSVTLGAASTQMFEVFFGLLNEYVFSSTDLADPGLTTKLATLIAGANQTPDASTLLYTPLQLNAIDASISQAFSRTLNVTSNIANGRIWVFSDYTSAAEQALEVNREQNSFAGIPMPTLNFQPPATPCWAASQVSPVGPTPAPSPVPGNACGAQFDPGSASARVYGGPLLVGANTQAVPFTGAWVKVAGIQAGQSSNVTLTGASTDEQITVNDPAAFAFNNYYSNQWNSCSTQSSCDYAVETSSTYFNQFNSSVSRPTMNWASIAGDAFTATNTVDVNTWGSADEPLSALVFCSQESLDTACQPLPAAGGSVTVQREYHDDGTNFPYYRYAAGTGVTSVGQAYSGGSAAGMVVVTGGSSTGTFSVTTPTYMGATGNTEFLHIDDYIGGIYDNSASTGASYDLYTAANWSVKVTDANGNTYTGATASPQPQSLDIQINGLTKTVAVKRIDVTYTVPSGTTAPQGWGIAHIYAWNQNMNSGLSKTRHPANIKRKPF